MKHTALNEIDFAKAIKETNTFKGFERFKQGLVIKRANIMVLYDKYLQATRHEDGIDYLKQNPNIFSNDIKMIEEVLMTNVDYPIL